MMATQKMRRTGLAMAAGIGIGAVSLLAGPASAARPGAERIEFEDAFEFEDFEVAAGCGVDSIITSIEVSGRGWALDSGSASIKERFSLTFTNPATGDQVFMDGVRNFKDAPMVETSSGGFTTLVFETTVTGSPERWHAPGFGTIQMDRGRVTFRTTVVIDESIDPEEADPVVSVVDEILDSRGSHTIAQNGFEVSDDSKAVICQALGGEFVGG